MVCPPFHVSVCPSPSLGLGWFGHRSVAPPAALVCWALLESRLRRSDALASGRTLSFSFLSLVFFLGRLLGLGLVGCDPAWVPTFFWGTLLPLSWFSLGGSCRLVVQAPGIFLEFLLGFFPLASSVCCWLEVVQVTPWLSTLRSLAVEVVTLVLCQVLVGLPSWGYSASGFLGTMVFLVFALGHLSQVGSVFFLSPWLWGCFPSCWWVWLLAFVRDPLPEAAAVGFGLRSSGRLSSLLTGRSCSFALDPSFLDLVGVGGSHRVPSRLSSFRMWSLFRVISVFCHYWSRTKVSIGDGFLYDVASHLGIVSSFSYILCRFVVAPSGWWPRFYLACHCTCQYPIFSWLPLLLSQVT